MKKRRFELLGFLIIVLGVAISSTAFADSLPIKDGRYNGDPVLVIKLTKRQKEAITYYYKPFSYLYLTKKQIKYIGKSAKMDDPPTKLILIRPSDAAGECTCGMANIGLILKNNEIEIPLRYLASDKEAEQRKID